MTAEENKRHNEQFLVELRPVFALMLMMQNDEFFAMLMSKTVEMMISAMDFLERADTENPVAEEAHQDIAFGLQIIEMFYENRLIEGSVHIGGYATKGDQANDVTIYTVTYKDKKAVMAKESPEVTLQDLYGLVKSAGDRPGAVLESPGQGKRSYSEVVGEIEYFLNKKENGDE